MIPPALLACILALWFRVEASWILALGAFVGWVLHALVAFADLNRKPEVNLRRAASLAARNKLVVVADANPALARGEPTMRARRAWLWLAVGLAGVPLAFAPAVLKWCGGWTENRNTAQRVVAPGDTVRVHLPDRVFAVGDLWAGTPQAVMTGPGEAEPVPLPARAPARSWGGMISEDSKSRNAPTPLWADVTLPNDPSLAGRPVQLRIDMAVEYPRRSGSGYDEGTKDVSHTCEITPVSQWQRTAYHWSLVSLAVGAIVIPVYGLMLWKSSKCLSAMPYRRRWPGRA
jgi:hypothetical protein